MWYNRAVADHPVITSRANPWFKRFRDAIELHRDEIAVEGPKHVADCMASGWKPEAVALSAGSTFVADARTVTFSERLFRTLSETVETQGVIAIFRRPELTAAELLARDGFLVVLDGIQDPGNAGTIVRLAAAFGAAGILASDGTADVLSPKALRASAATALALPCARVSRVELAGRSRSGALPLFAAVAGGGALPAVLPSRFGLVLGSEGRGISDEIAEVATPVGIEMSGAVESLNVGAAAAILLWQIQSIRRGARVS